MQWEYLLWVLNVCEITIMCESVITLLAFFYQLRLRNKRMGSLVPRIVVVLVNRHLTMHGADWPKQLTGNASNGQS